MEGAFDHLRVHATALDVRWLIQKQIAHSILTVLFKHAYRCSHAAFLITAVFKQSGSLRIEFDLHI